MLPLKRKFTLVSCSCFMPNICLYFALFPTVLVLYDIMWACGNTDTSYYIAIGVCTWGVHCVEMGLG